MEFPWAAFARLNARSEAVAQADLEFVRGQIAFQFLARDRRARDRAVIPRLHLAKIDVAVAHIEGEIAAQRNPRAGAQLKREARARVAIDLADRRPRRADRDIVDLVVGEA